VGRAVLALVLTACGGPFSSVDAADVVDATPVLEHDAGDASPANENSSRPGDAGDVPDVELHDAGDAADVVDATPVLEHDAGDVVDAGQICFVCYGTEVCSSTCVVCNGGRYCVPGYVP
jgi:hypothetical protein